MDYLTLALILLSVLMSIIALIMLYLAKPKDSAGGSRSIAKRVARATGDQPVDELYTTSKINSAIGLTIAAIVFGVGGAVSSSLKKAALVKRAIPYIRNAGILPTSTVLSS